MDIRGDFELTRKDCGPCMRAFMKSRPLTRGASIEHRARILLQSTWVDIGGPLVRSVRNKHHFIVFVDEASQHLVIEALRCKSDAPELSELKFC